MPIHRGKHHASGDGRHCGGPGHRIGVSLLVCSIKVDSLPGEEEGEEEEGEEEEEGQRVSAYKDVMPICSYTQ